MHIDSDIRYKPHPIFPIDMTIQRSSRSKSQQKSLVVLGDSFVERGELSQAKATFESVRDGYTPAGDTDDLQDAVKLRLEKLEVMISEKNNQ